MEKVEKSDLGEKLEKKESKTESEPHITPTFTVSYGKEKTAERTEEEERAYYNEQIEKINRHSGGLKIEPTRASTENLHKDRYEKELKEKVQQS